MAADVRIDIAAQFVGAKAFKQAETSTDKLTRSTKKLAKGLLALYSTQKLMAYAKNSIKAAAADEKAQIQLANALKNVGMERDAIGAEGYIQRLQKEFGILDDELRPAYQTLAIATKDAATTQKVLGVALDISAATGKDLNSVTAALSKAYLGNNTALSKLGVGISKADLKTKSFEEVVDQLGMTFAGSAKKSADSFQGSMNKLTVASTNASEIIGTGLIDALKMIGEDNSVSSLAQDMEDVALYIGDAIRGVGVLVEKLKSIPGAGVLVDAFKVFQKTSALGVLNTLGQASRTAPKPFSTAMTISGQVLVKQQTQVTKLTKEQAATQAKITKEKKLQAAIDKANLALNKGEEVFDMDKIQIAAALTNQAKQLGDATNAAQVLQIANDTARLNVKRSILNVEDAIASQDKDAIESALKKLDADLKVLGVLNNQKLTVGEISKLLKTLQAEDLKGTIEFSNNIEDTLNKLLSLYKVQTDAENTLYAIKLRNAKTLADVENDTLDRKLRGYSASALALEALVGIERQAAISKLASDIGSASLIQGIQSGKTPAQAAVGARYAAQAAYNYYIEITAGIGDPNAIAEAVDQVLTAAVQRGTLRGTYSVA